MSLYPAVKRGLDVLGAIGSIALLSPLLIGVGLLVRVVDGPPVLFKQVRPGKDRQSFTMYKFRTMSMERGPGGSLLTDERRMTWLGSLLRRASLDELPQLFNVLKGELSFVGPRPLLLEYLPLYTAEQDRRHEVRPGITGLAQIAGRNALDWPERLRLDVEYVDRRSFALDARILLLTVVRVVTGRGVRTPGEATARPFRGEL